MWSTNFPTKLWWVFNKLVYLVCLYNVLNYISPDIIFKCQVSSVLCNYRKERIKKQNQSTKESCLPLLACEFHLLQALETLSYLSCPRPVWIPPPKRRAAAPFTRRWLLTGLLLRYSCCLGSFFSLKQLPASRLLWKTKNLLKMKDAAKSHNRNSLLDTKSANVVFVDSVRSCSSF